jgi:hypothetical protein
LLKPKVAQNVTINVGYFIFSKKKNHNEPPKVAQSSHPEAKQNLASDTQGGKRDLTGGKRDIKGTKLVGQKNEEMLGI